MAQPSSVEAVPAPADPEEYVETKIPGGGFMYVSKKARASNRLFCLGCGGLAAAFDGFKVDGRDRIPVAIKQVALPRQAAERFEQMHFRGLQAMAGRAHPAIVKFIGFFKGDDGDGRTRLSFVFERCPMARAFLVDAETRGGYTLPIDARLAQGATEGCDLVNNPVARPPFRHGEALFVVRQLLDALVYLHGAKPEPIIFRDVKPDNILLWSAAVVRHGMDAEGTQGAGDGSGCAARCARYLTVKLTDYDTVRQYNAGDLTVGSGTRPFMAPEVDVQTGTLSQQRGGGPASSSSSSSSSSGGPPPGKAVGQYDPTVDVFSVGATYFYLVTGHAPSPDLRQSDWRRRFLGDEAFDPAEHAAALLGQVEGGGSGGGGAPPSFRVPSAGLGLAATKPPPGAPSGGTSGDVITGPGAAAAPTTTTTALNPSAAGGGIWGGATAAASSSESAPAAAAAAASPSPAPAVSILDHFFPPGSPHRAYLKGLVYRCPDSEHPAPPCRWTAEQALHVLTQWFPAVPTPEDLAERLRAAGAEQA